MNSRARCAQASLVSLSLSLFSLLRFHGSAAPQTQINFWAERRKKTTPQIYIMQAVLIASLLLSKNFHASFRFHLLHLATFIDNWLLAIKHTVPTTTLRRAQCSFETLYHANSCWTLTFLLHQTWIFLSDGNLIWFTIENVSHSISS